MVPPPLHAEIIDEIVSLVKNAYPNKRTTLALVNSRFYSLVQPSLYENVFLVDSRDAVRFLRGSRAARTRSGFLRDVPRTTKTLILRHVPGCYVNDILRTMPSLESLTIQPRERSERGIAAALEHLDGMHLRHLDVPLGPVILAREISSGPLRSVTHVLLHSITISATNRVLCLLEDLPHLAFIGGFWMRMTNVIPRIQALRTLVAFVEIVPFRFDGLVGSSRASARSLKDREFSYISSLIADALRDDRFLVLLEHSEDEEGIWERAVRDIETRRVDGPLDSSVFTPKEMARIQRYVLASTT